MKIWIDADACPNIIKEVVYKVSARLDLYVYLVANNYLSTPRSPLIQFIKVESGADVADKYIIEHIKPSDLVITADIPLAALALEYQAIALNPRGEVYTKDNIDEILSMRNFMQELRDNGIETSGPSALDAKTKEKFTNALDRTVTQILKRTS